MADNLNILIINGSTHLHSLNLRVAKVVHSMIEKSNNKSTLLHLGEENVPLFWGYDVPYSKRVREIMELVSKADGFMIVTPEYHRMIPAVLKNLFEYIDDPEGIVKDKPVALISATPGQFVGIHAQFSVYGMLRTLGIWLVPD